MTRWMVYGWSYMKKVINSHVAIVPPVVRGTLLNYCFHQVLISWENSVLSDI